jgi:hypothetical protein
MKENAHELFNLQKAQGNGIYLGGKPILPGLLVGSVIAIYVFNRAGEGIPVKKSIDTGLKLGGWAAFFFCACC